MLYFDNYTIKIYRRLLVKIENYIIRLVKIENVKISIRCKTTKL